MESTAKANRTQYSTRKLQGFYEGFCIFSQFPNFPKLLNSGNSFIQASFIYFAHYAVDLLFIDWAQSQIWSQCHFVVVLCPWSCLLFAIKWILAVNLFNHLIYFSLNSNIFHFVAFEHHFVSGLRLILVSLWPFPSSHFWWSLLNKKIR